ncbi:serine aminopeptidase domain-containing protein [Mucilaginibacter sp. KACC 22063]|uniref:serine aminopeptidase domain-containing protein n=1 Tax=Mucilaginibacter sp. KACC 22063 TaxID=3025666 RepID=UPI0023664F18|nr:alpha/beta hydrolase [Mucilaginibacter sp. KACC 22063]WDF56589.1 alpha/beta hydrolase [Mucilaginibacter sp. KACC 22063]
MKKLLLVIALFAIKAYGQGEPLNYKNAIVKFKRYYNAKQSDSIFSMFSPEVRNTMTADKNAQAIGQLQAQSGSMLQTSFLGIDKGVATYKIGFSRNILAMKISLNSKDQLAGLLFDNYTETGSAKPPVKPIESSSAIDASDGESAYKMKGLTGTIYGTLTMPANASGKVPVVIIVPGSGPIDRNGNSAKLGINANSYKLLAQEFRKNGIASLRYDKRMVGESTGTFKESQLRFGDYVDDAVGMISQLHDDERFSKVIMLGHGEGSLVAIVSSRDQPVAGFISLEGAGRPAYEILTEQAKAQTDYVGTRFKSILDSLRRGKVQDNVDASLYSFARPSIQPYLMTWMQYDPQHFVKIVKVPTLVIQGTSDLQSTVADAERLKKGRSDVQMTIIPEMNYVLKSAPVERDKNLATYTNPDLPLKPELMPAILSFISKLK